MVLLDIGIPGWLFFSVVVVLPFCIYQLTTFWSPKFLMRKLLINLIEDILYVTIHFCLAAFKSLSLSFESLIIMCLTVCLWVHFTWNQFIFLDVYIQDFHQICEVFSHYYFKHSPSLFLFLSLDSQRMCSLAWCPTSPLRSVHFSSIFFLSVPQTDKFPCPIFKFAVSSAYSDLPWNHCSKFFFLLYFPNPEFLCKFSFYWYFHFAHTSLLFLFCLVYLPSGLPQVRFNYFLPFNGIHFPVSLYAIFCCWKLDIWLFTIW